MEQNSDVTYKLRHKSTGLFFRPSKAYPESSRFSQLHKTGKTYHVKPSFMYVKDGIYINGRRKFYNKSDWEIVEFEVKEIGIHELK